MISSDFAHVDTWVFDLDNTLYPPSDRLFDQIEERMRHYVARALDVDFNRADYLRDHYWRTHGTTLAGLMAEHGVEPEAFMVDVHDIDMSHMQPAPALRTAISALPGRKIVYTNGSRPYANRVLAARGLSGVFEAVYGVEHAGYVPKPQLAAYEAVFAQACVSPVSAAMFEDDLRNLEVPHAMGMRTVHVADAAEVRPHVHHHTADLAGFLSQVRAGPFPGEASSSTFGI